MDSSSQSESTPVSSVPKLKQTATMPLADLNNMTKLVGGILIPIIDNVKPFFESERKLIMLNCIEYYLMHS